MRILVVDDSNPHRRLLTALFNRVGHEVLTAPDGVAALALLDGTAVDAIVSDVRMPRMDGFQLCRTIRQDPRWGGLPFIFYSSVFIDNPARELGRDIGATAYLDAKDVAPAEVARELETLVARHVRAEYSARLGRLLDDVEFARRYHQVVLSALGSSGSDEVRDVVASSAEALDRVVERLDAQRRTLSENESRAVQRDELELLRELHDYLGDRINNPLAVILASAQLAELKAPGRATSEAAQRITDAVQKISEVVRGIGRFHARDGGAPPPPAPDDAAPPADGPRPVTPRRTRRDP